MSLFKTSFLKWSGSKRKQALGIVRHFPADISAYYEPFLGGGSVFLRAVELYQDSIPYRLSDACAPLVGIWQTVRQDPSRLASTYREHWLRFGQHKDYYYKIRERFNEAADPCDFFFLLRTCYGGLVRFNAAGKFNSPVHHGRPGMRPDAVWELIRKVHHGLHFCDVQFTHCDYRTVDVPSGGFLYCDPPYLDDTAQMYGTAPFFFDHFHDWLGTQKCRYAVSLYGERDGRPAGEGLPEHLYADRVLIEDQGTTFDRLKGRKISRSDALYLR